MPSLLFLLVACGSYDLLERDGRADGGPTDPSIASGPAIQVESEDTCRNPCTFTATADPDITRATWSADGWALGSSSDPSTGFAVTYTFNTLGDRKIKVVGYDASGREVASDSRTVHVDPAAEVSLLTADTCVDPCTFTAEASGAATRVRFEADGWTLGVSSDAGAAWAVTYDFHTLGDRVISAVGLDASGAEVARDTRTVHVDGADGDCPAYTSSEQEYAPVQVTGSGLPSRAASLSWRHPTSWTWTVGFSGTPGQPASHEGEDFVHDDPDTPSVTIQAAAAGEVAYVRLGCPQSTTFSSNRSSRECGAGWGNHVVVDHGGGLYTRYAHLDGDAVWVEVGDAVDRGTSLAAMGNSGRSDVRHLHFELGTYGTVPDPCAPAFSFDRVYDPEDLAW